MPDPVTTTLLMKLIAPVVKAGKWAFELFSSRTKLQLLLNRVEDGEDGEDLTAYVYDEGERVGLFYFGVTTKNRSSVEVTAVKILFDAAVVLSDPEDSSFFQATNSPDPQKPFAIEWIGLAEVKAGLIKTFGVISAFQNEVVSRNVEVIVTARKKSRSFGYVKRGSPQEFKSVTRIELTDRNTLGILIPKLAVSQSEQPYMATAFAGLTGNSGLVQIHGRDSTGQPTSEMVDMQTQLTEQE